MATSHTSSMTSLPQPLPPRVIQGGSLQSTVPATVVRHAAPPYSYVASPPRVVNTVSTVNPLVSAASFHSTASSFQGRVGGVTYTASPPSYANGTSAPLVTVPPSLPQLPGAAKVVTRSLPTVMSPTSQVTSAPSHVPASGPMVTGLNGLNGNKHWFTVATEKVWPAASRHICKYLLNNFDDGHFSEQKLDEMSKTMSSMPPRVPLTAEWINFILKQVWEVVQPSVSKAVKEMLKPKLHNALSMVAPIDIDPCLLGDEPPQMDEIELLPDQGLGNWMDLKIHFFWHSEPDITVSCKLGSVALPKLKVGFTMYLGLQGEADEPPFFNAAVLYMGNGFMHARDVLGTVQERQDPYIGMTFGDAWAGFSVSFVEDAVVSALNSVIVPKLVLPQRMVVHASHGIVPFDLLMPKPRGCLQITVKGVTGLVGTEWKLQSLLTGSRSNDPYVMVDLAGELSNTNRTLRTPTCYNELNPTWDDQNSFFFVIDSVRLQHFNFRVFDDGLLQMFREQQIGMASQEDLMARRLGLSVMELFGISGMDFFDREQQVDQTCSLDMMWPGKEEHEELRNAQANVHLSLHWRPIVYSHPSMLPSEIFMEDDEPEPVWPHFVLRVCFRTLEMRKFSGKQTDQFFIKATVMPGFDYAGSHHDEPKDGVSEVVSKKVYPQHQQNEDRAEMVSRMTGGRMGRACRVATFDQAFRFMVRDPRATKIHLSFNSVADFDKTDVHELGEMTLDVNSLLREKDLARDIKDEELDNWEGGEVPARFSGHVQLFQLHNVNNKQAVAQTKAQQASMNKEIALREAQQLVQKASALRAEADALERQARAKDSERNKRHKGERNSLKVRITSARGLRAADFTLTRWGTSDPYCSCELAGKAKSGFKTNVVEKTLEPYWDYEGTVNKYKSGMPLKFSVYDRDFSYKDDLLGSVTVSAAQFHPNGFVGELKLVDPQAAAGQEAFLQVEIADIHGEFPADEKEGSGSALKVKIVAARGFQDDSKGLFGKTTACLFSTCEIMGKARSSMRTQAIEHTGQPEWNYERHMRSFKSGDVLLFKVVQEQSGKDYPLMMKQMKAEDFYPNGFAGVLEMDPVGSWSGASDLKPQLEVLISNSEGKYPKMMLPDSKLEVRILSARDLKASDVYLLQQSSSDPYCKCEVVGKPLSRFRTKTVDQNLFPVWNHQSRLRGYEQGDSIKFTIFDEDYVSQDDELGYAVLKSEDFHAEGFYGELRLQGTDVESYIKVQISTCEGEFLNGVKSDEDKARKAGLGPLQIAKSGLGVVSSFICSGSKK
ncbi:Ras GTPase-activating protein 4 (Calcium-promoted Ras inactivator) (Ras p21 protein activator 4) (RasGAP-activating-like protein 2) [Durusdinium trenchii]|uniref:Ras GTPase-activating protein 4 (Calcium-promoted Ras inactivator) (Ras p21 protein activator 4) (RasGAP-activating-like protein 2) n=1 Tax=Durusdinium trenchii TaxID=1381693 RepID=A0ABP0LEW5_9DINO